MARAGLLETNKRRLLSITNFSQKRRVLKMRIMDRSLDMEERFALAQKLAAFPKNSVRGRYRNRCSLTGRPRAVYRDFGVCRIIFRQLAVRGYIPGVTHSSW